MHYKNLIAREPRTYHTTATTFDLMNAAGYVGGEKYDLTSPVILHKDNIPTNFNSSNLEWVEAIDPGYLEYQKRFEEWQRQRNIELNSGKPLPPGW